MIGFLFEAIFAFIILYVLFFVGISVLSTLMMVIGFVGYQDTHNLLFILLFVIGFSIGCRIIR